MLKLAAEAICVTKAAQVNPVTWLATPATDTPLATDDPPTLPATIASVSSVNRGRLIQNNTLNTR